MHFARKAERKAEKDKEFFAAVPLSAMQKLLSDKFVHFEDAICFIYTTYEKDAENSEYRIIINDNDDDATIDKSISEEYLLERLEQSDNKIFHIAKKKLPEYFVWQK